MVDLFWGSPMPLAYGELSGLSDRKLRSFMNAVFCLIRPSNIMDSNLYDWGNIDISGIFMFEIELNASVQSVEAVQKQFFRTSNVHAKEINAIGTELSTR